MAILLSTPARNLAANAVVGALDSGAGAGKLKIYTTGQGTLLGTLTFSEPAFAGASVGVATASAITSDASADNTGVAAEFVASDFTDTVIFSGSVGTIGSGEDMEMNTVNIVAGGPIGCSSFTFTQPAS